jgi:hypothetical protein
VLGTFDRWVTPKQLTVLRLAQRSDQTNLSLPTYRRAVIHMTRLGLLEKTETGTGITMVGRSVLRAYEDALKG